MSYILDSVFEEDYRTLNCCNGEDFLKHEIHNQKVRHFLAEAQTWNQVLKELDKQVCISYQTQVQKPKDEVDDSLKKTHKRVSEQTEMFFISYGFLDPTQD